MNTNKMSQEEEEEEKAERNKFNSFGGFFLQVLFDVSSSMGTKEEIGGDKTLRRIDIAKELFYAFSDRVMAYALPSHISLILFNDNIIWKHPFTSLFENFKVCIISQHISFITLFIQFSSFDEMFILLHILINLITGKHKSS
jgi:hypothetical protein